jgi:hypothetical protein
MHAFLQLYKFPCIYLYIHTLVQANFYKLRVTPHERQFPAIAASHWLVSHSEHHTGGSLARGKMSCWPCWHFSTSLILPGSVPWKSRKGFSLHSSVHGPKANQFLFFSSRVALQDLYLQDNLICSLPY